MPDWVLAVERAYVAAATGTPPSGGDPAVPAPSSASAPPSGARLRSSGRSPGARAKAAAAAVASRFLAVGTPRSMGFASDDAGSIDEAVLTLEAHRTWFQPSDLRCTSDELARRIGGRVVTLEEAFAADIVNLHAASRALEARHLRRGTHVNVLTAPAAVADDARAIATVVDEARGLPALAAGIVDGRQLDEITICFVGDAPIALAALADRG